jgi:hypothetical protein
MFGLRISRFGNLQDAWRYWVSVADYWGIYTMLPDYQIPELRATARMQQRMLDFPSWPIH